MGLQVVQQSSSVSSSLQDGLITTRAKSQKKTYSKVFDGIAKSMDPRRRKLPPKITEANASSNSLSSSGGGRTAWWRQRARSFGDQVQVRLSSASRLPERRCRQFSLGEMRAATNNFHINLIIKYGDPATGAEMYRGYVNNGYLQVAIERLSTRNKSRFLQRVELLRTQVYHPNLVPFIGYCNEEDEMILVYQYMVGGNLSNHLYGGGGTGGNEKVLLPLPWKKRLEICVGAAQGLEYLHNMDNPEDQIIHGDIKSSRILLDEKWVAKISGLKFSRGGGGGGGGDGNNSLLHDDANTNKSRTSIAMAAANKMYGDYNARITKEHDVYSFGVVLLEVLCGREALIPHLKKRGEKNLVHWFKSCLQKKREMDGIIDEKLVGKIAPKCLRVFVRAVECCLRFRAADRPSMDVVLRRLQDALLLQQGAEENHLIHY